jgi:GTPase SAR1 family protein
MLRCDGVAPEIDYQLDIVYTDDPADRLVVRIVRSESNAALESMVGKGYETDICIKEIDQKLVRVRYWDAKIQPESHEITSDDLRGVVGALLNYSCSDRKSFMAMTKTLTAIREHGQNDIAVVLEGITNDSPREICIMYASQWAMRNGVLNVETAFDNKLGQETIVHLLLTETVRTMSRRDARIRESTAERVDGTCGC